MSLGCIKCNDLCVESKIESKNNFGKALRIIRQNLKDSTILESAYWPEGKIKSCTTAFHDVNQSGPYSEDIYIYYFSCSECSQLFEFVCNTYHGSGGHWRPVKNDF